MTKFIGSLSSFLFLFIYAHETHADDWVCRSQASKMQGPDSVLVCGVGESPTESKARSKSRENAIAEFKSLCSQTSCAERDFNITPARMECEGDDSKGYKCFRALEFTLGTPKAKTKLNRDALEAELTERRNQLRRLESQYAELKQVENQNRIIEDQIKALRVKMSTREIEIEHTELRLNDNRYLWSNSSRRYTVRVGIGYLGLHPTGIAGDFLTFSMGFEYRLLNYLGLEAKYLGGGGSGKSRGEIPSSGTANSSDQFEGSSSVSGVGLSARLYGLYGGWYPVLGYQSLKAKGDSYAARYGPLGTLSGVDTTQRDIDLSGYSVGLGWSSLTDDKGWIWDAEIKYFQPTETKLVDPGISLNLGIGYGF